MSSLPVDAVIAITYRCDSRCNMCNIWKLPPTEELEVEDFRKLPPTLRDVNITGGEPFLRDDIVDIVRVIHDRCNDPRIVISTNGFQRRRILNAAPDLMKISKKVGIGISIDGIGDKHDEIRGVNGAFDRVMDTLKQLKKIGYKNVRVAFTAQQGNIKHLGAVYDLSRQFGYQFTTSVAQNSELYFSTMDNPKVDDTELESELKYVMRKELKSLSPKRWLRAYFYSGVIEFNRRKHRVLGCRAGRDSFFMDPTGNIYPCLMLNYRMGNIRQSSFEEIWSGDASKEARGAVDRCNQPCWMICTARASIIRNPLKPMLWIAKSWVNLVLRMDIE